ncbi:MAG TPA: sialidase family protein [Actinomycetes bacterium]
MHRRHLAIALAAVRNRTQAATAAGAIPPSVDGTSGCPDSSATNVRANQDCTNASLLPGRGQGQNEPTAAVDPGHPRRVLAGQNDYRRGDAACGADFSLDGGRHFGSELVPAGFTTPGLSGGQRHYWSTNGDPSVAFDSKGTAYYFCLAFDRFAPTSDVNSFASGLFLYRSTDGGASWSFPGSLVKQEDGLGAIGLLDKPYMTVDTGAHSRFRDRIYVAWVEYNAAFTANPVSFAYSDDAGATWHLTGTITGTSASLCPVTFDGSPPGTCNATHFPQPFVAPNGDLYVVFQNFNNALADPADNHSQMLIVKSTDGGASFGGPVKVSDYYDLPDCLTYTGANAGRPCVPTAPLSNRNIFRATNYPVGVAPSNDTVLVTLGSYVNRHSNPALGNCTPAGVSATTGLNTYQGVGVVDGCNNDIVLSTSSDGGASFTGGSTPVAALPSVSDERAGGHLADQWWQWAALTPGGKLASSYYDRKYGDDQSSGQMDVTLRRGNGAHVRVTDASMPPPAEFPASATVPFSTFFGDYSGLAVGSDGMAHPVWVDSRNPSFAPGSPDPRRLVTVGPGSDIYTRRLPA